VIIFRRLYLKVLTHGITFADKSTTKTVHLRFNLGTKGENSNKSVSATSVFKEKTPKDKIILLIDYHN